MTNCQSDSPEFVGLICTATSEGCMAPPSFPASLFGVLLDNVQHFPTLLCLSSTCATGHAALTCHSAGRSALAHRCWVASFASPSDVGHVAEWALAEQARPGAAAEARWRWLTRLLHGAPVTEACVLHDLPSADDLKRAGTEDGCACKALPPSFSAAAYAQQSCRSP